MSPLASVLTGVRGERIALSDVSVSATLRDLLGEVTVCQTYRNDEDVNIEAVYTFPLPLDAVLLELRVEIGGRTLNGVVVEKKAAEDQYEDAVAAGDAAVMLEAIEPGLYTLNVGNLLPKETATISFVYAMVYRWVGDTLRVSLPTTVAPRYGTSPHAPQQVPESSLEVENQFSLQVEVFGSLREAQFVCPSHAVTLASSPESTVITLTQAKAVMDRDFIMTVKAPQATHSFAIYGADGEGAAAITSFRPLFPGLQQPRSLDLAIVIDCSGSMQGDSIAQAEQALAGILDALQPRDRVTVVAFGDTTKQLSEALLPCTPANLRKAKKFAAELEADMGGTEIGPALQAAYAAAIGSESGDVFVVTDGEVSSWQAVVAEAGRFGRRVFTVGVGSAVSEAFVRELAAATGGGCELVSPREGMAGRVIRHFERMRAPRAKRVAIHWPAGARDLAPVTFGAVFEGDTVTASAQFDHPVITGQVTLEIETDGGDVFRQQLALTPPQESTNHTSTVARLAASARLKELEGVGGLEQALRYGLVSPWTNWLVVSARPDSEKALEIPALRKVPQTLAAGWSGIGELPVLSVASRQPSRHRERRRARAHRVFADHRVDHRLQPPDSDASAGDSTDLERDSAESMNEIVLELSGLLSQANGLDRGVEALTIEAQQVVASLQEHTQRVEHELRAIANQAGALRSEIDMIQNRLPVLRQQIAELENRANDSRGATGPLDGQQGDGILHEMLMRLAAVRKLLAQLDARLAQFQEREVKLGHLHAAARDWAEAVMRYRH